MIRGQVEQLSAISDQNRAGLADDLQNMEQSRDNASAGGAARREAVEVKSMLAQKRRER